LRETQAKPRLLVLVATLALAVTTASATLALFAAEAQATARASETSFDPLPPKTALMKGPEVLQARSFAGAQWYYYQDGEWWASYYDNFGRYTFPKAVVLKKGTRLHVRIFKPERPNVQVNSHTRKGKNGMPVGPNQPLEHTFKRVERNGETYAWDVFFRVGQSEHNYYVVVHPLWKRVPGAHTSYGDANYAFHVKTR
jgi:hypothetical protein